MQNVTPINRAAVMGSAQFDVLTRVKAASNRLNAIDIVRGLAMMFMLVGHSAWHLPYIDLNVHFGWHTTQLPLAATSAIAQHPETWLNLLQGTPLFFILSGFSLALFEASRYRRGWTDWRITRYFFIRGLVLILIDLFILPWDLFPHITFELTTGFAFLSIGLCLWAMVFLRRLRPRYLLAISFALIFGTQVLYYNTTSMPADYSLARSLFLHPRPFEAVGFGFPVLPWLGVILFGFASAKYVMQDTSRFAPYTLRVGVTLLAMCGFIMLFNGFGRLYHGNPLIFSKHPPDLAFLTFYLGIAFLLLHIFNRFIWLENALPFRLLAMLGQTSFFFYVAHFYVMQVYKEIIASLTISPYLMWGMVYSFTLVTLFFVCTQYREIRKRYPDSILQYL